jgi:ribose transport system permease protein
VHRTSVFATKLGRLILGRRALLIFLINIILFISFSAANPYFFSVLNMESIGYGILSVGIISVGMMIVMIGNGFDLSVGSILAFSGVILSKMMESGTPIGFAIMVALILGACIGCINGLLITHVGINPFIATLGTMSMVRGLALAVTQGMPIYGLPRAFAVIGSGRLLGAPIPILLMVGLVVLADQFMRRTTWGRLVYYVGGNIEAAELSGIHVKNVRIATYMMTGIMASVAGIVLTSRMMSMMATAGTGVELKAIAACIIGGAALGGGEGTVLGALMGTLLVGLIDNILILSNVSTYWQLFSSGLILVVVVSLDMIMRKISHEEQ